MNFPLDPSAYARPKSPEPLRNDIDPHAHTARNQTYFGRMKYALGYLVATNPSLFERAQVVNGSLVVRWIESAKK